MASLADLFNPTFLMFLGILVLVAALIVVYFESKIRDQNHKVASMLSLVSTLAEDMNGIKLGLNHLAVASFGGANRQPFFQPPLEEENQEDEEDEEDEEDVQTGKLNNYKVNEKKENKLISVSDDESDADSDSDIESNADDEDSLLDSVSDDSESEINEDDFTEHNDIKVLKLNISNDLFDNSEHTKDDLEDLEVLEVLEDNLSDTQSVELNGDLVLAEEKNEDSLLTSDFKTININLEDSNNESIDYKKLSLTKLRSIVSEKGLSTDSSKLKKQDLLKLLGVE